MSKIEEKRYVGKRERINSNLYERSEEKREKLKKIKIKEKIKLKPLSERTELFEKIEKNKIKDIQLAQFIRFHKFVKENNYEITEEVREFVKKQNERGIAKKFYENILNELKGNKEYNKTMLCLIEKYLKYEFGKERIEDKLK